jgi:hypothetical protein
MRTASPFLQSYRKLLPNAARPGQRGAGEEPLVDLALHFLARFAPEESVAVLPFLLAGYPQPLNSQPEALRALQSLRHHAAVFASAYAWSAALEVFEEIPEVNRAYRVTATRRVELRTAAPDAVLDLLESTLSGPAPPAMRKLTLAKPGTAWVYVDHRRTQLEYTIPAYRQEETRCRQYALTRRAHNPPIAVRWSALLDVARDIDRVESVPGWSATTGLTALNLTERLKKIRLQPVDHQLFRDDILTLEGVRHIVGMLSSGKSTLVLALLFALARPEYGKRILVLSPDTTAAAILNARLRTHGISSTVLASFHRRDEHLSAIHWHQAMTGGGGWSMSGIGRLVTDFGVACPLDGHQLELKAVTGADRGERRFPLMSEKPCHSRIEQDIAGDTSSSDDEEEGGSALRRSKRSCPLFSRCPAQSQQRAAVDAHVLIMTAPAFLLMRPDRHVLEDSMSFPELAQFTRDLVIIDEADEVQRRLDGHFAVPAAIMGGEGSYLPESARALHTALQQKGGAQYASRLNVAWQARLSRLEVAVSGLYSVLLNRWDDVSHLSLESEFTAATILCNLWKTRADRVRGKKDFQLTGETEVAFQRILAMAGRLAALDEPDPMARDDAEQVSNEPEHVDPTCKALVELREKLRNGVSWRALLPETIESLGGALKDFNTFQHVKDSGSKQLQAQERNALAILAALYANIVLSTFNFLVRNQAAVSSAFQLDSYTLLDETRELIRQYRSLIPESPGGNTFGLVYERKEQNGVAGGDLKLISSLGVGRYLLTNLHSLLESEGQAGPHVLLLSGTSWAGGRLSASTSEFDNHGTQPSIPKRLARVSVASPSYDVQVPVAAYLEQPEQERNELQRSTFELLPVPGVDGKPVSVSGLDIDRRRLNLQRVAQHLTAKVGDRTRIEAQWNKNEVSWGKAVMRDRRRALCVVQSYRDAIVVANAIQRQIDSGLAASHRIYALVGDDSIRPDAVHDPLLRRLPGVTPLPRSLIEDFGRADEGSILVAPLTLLARGHNILNTEKVAAISLMYFLHRPHPRPDDRSGIIGQVNRFAIDCLRGDILELQRGTMLERGRLQRYMARLIARRALSARGGYSMMPSEEQARFAWDLITPLWQAIGRGIRGGVPVHAAFVDARFSPGLFEGETDTPQKSCLLQVSVQLRAALDPQSNPEWQIAEKLYGPLYGCLERMFAAIGNADARPEYTKSVNSEQAEVLERQEV